MSYKSSKYLIPFAIIVLIIYVIFVGLLFFEEKTNYFSGTNTETQSTNSNNTNNLASFPISYSNKPNFTIDEVKSLSNSQTCYIAYKSKVYDIPKITFDSITNLKDLCGKKVADDFPFESTLKNYSDYYVANLVN